ncbi:MAG: outer membrane protein assembly factor BamD [Candidatus Krumholzibacteria bacterium]|nr:outer membrane protein assembly factor BamD [Candidatus Krumholzibacteria bacterium]MDH4337973.1 outer membrane protein assembly factor BamD [Candidatus Krumholzibacteria bacterium]MDH5268892.1 outer membrane protein assembly factor BamD [Candidatus Krumholzibacteria bacterium]MDH5626841.1 outer membrane protein assembly factor BamD [Candidatus Krumholzibacteria bacterium]
MTRRRIRLRTAVLFAVALAVVSGCVGGMPKVPATPDAVLERAQDYQTRGKYIQAAALYQQFLERYAGHERADFAQYMLAETHFEDRDYSLAAVEFQVVISNYGYSEYVDDALFKIGVCYWNQAPRSQRDQQKSFDALSRFNQYRQTFPEGEYADEVEKYVREINERLAQKEYAAARWYYRQKHGAAAMIYCDKIIENYPDNRYWAQALLLKGDILLRRGENEEAIRQYTRLLEYPGDAGIRQQAETKIREARR